MPDDLFDGGSFVEVVEAERLGPYPERGVVGVVAVVIAAVEVGFEGEGAFFFLPQVVDGLGHIAWGGVGHLGQIGVFPGVGDTGVGYQVLFPDGVGDAVKQVFRDVEQPLDPVGVSRVVAVGEVVGVGEVFCVVVAIEEDHLVFVFFFVLGDLEEVAFQFLEGVILVGVEEVSDEDVDTGVVNEAFPGVSAVDVADDVVGSTHYGKAY